MISDFAQHSLGFNLAAFTIAAAIVWLAGSKLTVYADLIADRTNLSRIFVGVLLLGTATSLPEMATTITASVSGNAALAGGNLFGGVAMQLAVLAAIDAIGLPRKALTFVSPRPVLLMQGVLLILMIAVAAGAIAVGEILTLGWIGSWTVILAALYLLALYSIHHFEGAPRWEPSGDVEVPPGGVDLKDERHGRFAGTPMRSIVARLLIAMVGILIGGYFVARTGEALAEQTGLGSGFVGATLVALATSLPEVSTTWTAVKIGAYGKAVANIVGTNALEIALFLPADLFYTSGPIMDQLSSSAIFLAMLGIVMTCLYLWGLLERRDHVILGMGIDSLLVLLIYLAGMSVFYSVGLNQGS